MYKGEVIIESKRLGNLRRTAKELNISGFIFIEEMDYPHAAETNEKVNQTPPISKLGLYPPGEGRCQQKPFGLTLQSRGIGPIDWKVCTYHAVLRSFH